MFDFLFLGSVYDAAAKTLRDNPRESIAGIAAVLIVPEVYKRYTDVQLAKIRSANDVEIARLERETAELKFKTAQMFEVEKDTPSA